eukprot:15295221-Alexandrium_andersonii.AAC.1
MGLCLSPEAEASIRASIQDPDSPSLCDSAGIEDWMQDLLRTHHQQSWVRPKAAQGAPACTVGTERGVKQGDVPAGKLFMLDHADVLGRIRLAFRELGLLTTFPIDTSIGPRSKCHPVEVAS